MPLHHGHTQSMNNPARLLTYLILAAILATLALTPLSASAQVGALSTPFSIGDGIRSQLSQAQLALTDSSDKAKGYFKAAQALYTGDFADMLATDAPDTSKLILSSFTQAEQAITAKDSQSLADARSTLWTGLLNGSYAVVEASIEKGDVATAKQWLLLREYRRATRFARPNADGTLALINMASGTITATAASVAVRADLLDGYQARLDEALRGITSADSQGFTTRRVEYASLARGYFSILTPAYREQQGKTALDTANAAFTQLMTAARTGTGLQSAQAAVEASLHNFRAAPLTAEDQQRRAGQLIRYLSLVPVEYGRGIRDGQVAVDLEITEASTFLEGAMVAFTDLQIMLEGRDKAKTEEISGLLTRLDGQVSDAAAHKAAVSPDEISVTTQHVLDLLSATMPSEWQQHDSAADFDVIGSVLDQMQQAVGSGQYDLAESARLEAYSVLESGPEARLVVFAPELKVPLEDLFWYGQGENKGLAALIRDHASLTDVKASRAALDVQLSAASKVVGGTDEPVAVATNAAIIVFREGLEAVLILASLLGSLKQGANRRFRAPIWWGAGVALIVTAITWGLLRSVLSAFARYGEMLEAIVSLVAIGVLLLITNWFFHKVYWTGWIANFHAQKKRLIGGEAGQILGLVILGFTSIYREGFEVTLFLQALVLEAGVGAVLAGVGLGLFGTFLVGLIVFALQAKLPYKRMLVVTGVMISAVLVVMVGNTAHVLQVVGWLPIHPLSIINFPYWTGTWLGVYNTWEGIILQMVSGGFVIGSYFLAEKQRDRKAHVPRTETATVS